MTILFCQSVYIRNFITTKNHNQAILKAQSSALFVTVKRYLYHITVDHHYLFIGKLLSTYYISSTSASSAGSHSSRSVPWGLKKLDCVRQLAQSPICAAILHSYSPTPLDFGYPPHQYYLPCVNHYTCVTGFCLFRFEAEEPVIKPVPNVPFEEGNQIYTPPQPSCISPPGAS